MSRTLSILVEEVVKLRGDRQRASREPEEEHEPDGGDLAAEARMSGSS
jgi:hypothetical protein